MKEIETQEKAQTETALQNRQIKEKSSGRSVTASVLKWAVFAVLVLYALSLLFPLAWGFMTSLKNRMDFGRPNNNVLGFPKKAYSSAEMFKLNNYKLILQNFYIERKASFYMGDKLITHSTRSNIGGLLLNTVLYAGVGSLIMAVVPAIVAYMCCKYKYKFSNAIYYVALFVMILPIVGAYPSEITLLRNLGIYDTMWGNWIQKFSFVGMYFFVYHAFYEGMSDTFTEAAEIDGASQLRILTTIILPLSVKMIGTVMLLQFITLWNDYQTPLLYLPTHPTLAYGIYNLIEAGMDGAANRILGNVPTKVAGCMLLAIPILVLFIVFRKKIMGNVSMGGLKE